MEASYTIKRLQHSDESQQAYCCMTELPTPWPRALCCCREWVAGNVGKYVEGYHAHLGDDVVGHLYYALSQHALIPYEVEPDVGVLYCEWVHRKHQGKGLVRLLFNTFREDMQREGIKGILVEATDAQDRMHFEHYLKRGFASIHEGEHLKLLYMPLGAESIKAQPIQSKIQERSGSPVEILILKGYMCPYEAATLTPLRTLAQEFGERVVLREVALTPKTVRAYGTARGFFINGRRKLAGGESEEEIRRAITEEF